MSSADLRRQRLALGLSVRSLAERTGLTTAAIEHLERHGDLPQRSPARRVREALGLPPPVDDHDSPMTPTDDITVEALIVDQRVACSADCLADALTWTLPRVLAAIRALDRRLQGTGQTVIQDADRRYTLGSRTSVIYSAARRRAHEVNLSDPNATTASTLLKILEGAREQRRWSNFASREQHDAIRGLLAADLIQDNGVTLRPTDRARTAFGIEGDHNTSWRVARVELSAEH